MQKVGLLIFSEGRVREDVYQNRKPAQDRESAALLEIMRGKIDFMVPAPGKSGIKTIYLFPSAH